MLRQFVRRGGLRSRIVPLKLRIPSQQIIEQKRTSLFQKCQRRTRMVMRKYTNENLN